MDRHLFNRSTLIPDLSAGLVLGIQSIPSGMANGLLALVNPIYGLHGYMVGVLTGAFFTSSVFMSVQGTSAMALVIASVPEVAQGGYPNSALFTLAFLTGLLMLAAGLFKIGNPGGIGASLTTSGSWFQVIFETLMSPLNSTMYALLAFFIASASYRAFRARNREATILLVAAFIVLLGRTPLGQFVTDWVPDAWSIFRIPDLSVWIMTFPNLAGQRAIMIGVSLGVVSMSLRLILGIERTYLGGDKG